LRRTVVTIKFKNVSGSELAVFKPEGDPQSRNIEPGGVLELTGKLVTSRPEPKDDEPPVEPLPEDAYVVEVDGDERAFSHALWELVGDKPKTAAKPADKEN
jgi:hypothetical protein